MDKGLASSTNILFVCFLSFLFTFASARVPLEIIGIHRSNPDSFPFSVSQENPADPTQKPESEPVTLIQWEPQTSDSEPNSQPKPQTVDLTEKPTESIDRLDLRIPRRPSPLSSRLSHRCQYYRKWYPRLPRREMPHGDNVGHKDSVKMARGTKQMARGWIRFGHVKPRFSRERDLDMELLRRLHRRHRREQQNKETEYIKRIRKFLNHF